MIRYIKTSTLRQYCDPTKASCWPGFAVPISVAEVNAVLDVYGEWLDTSNKAPWYKWWARDDARRITVGKIAWFARNGFSDPIQVDVGIPSMRCHVGWFVQDGNHRLAAAVVRQDLLGEDHWLPVETSGSVQYAKSLGLWGVAVRPEVKPFSTEGVPP